MERIHSINAERIAWCCADYGITPNELASRLDIAASRMEKLMTGDSSLTFNQLRKIADYFGRGVLFFLEEGPVDEARVHTPQFRTLANRKPEVTPELKKLIERTEQQRKVYLSLIEDLDEPERLRFNPPDIHGLAPSIAAREVRAWLKLGNSNDFDSYRAAIEAQGILVFRSNGYSGKWQIPKENPIQGFTLYDPVCPVIVVKKQPSERRQSFTLMHELAHLLVHRSSSIDDETDLYSHEGHEREANAFAGNLLVPDEFLATIDDPARPDEVSQFDPWLDRYCKTWGVSSEVILRRLMDTGRLPQSEYNAYRQWRTNQVFPEKDGGSRKYRHREPKHVFGDPFVRTVLGALNNKQITLAKASGYLDSIKIKDLHQLEHYYAGL
ncbi:MAG TPA: ImmA/IrrE family metallo-endopeptidase [Chlorobaculum parvum]|uniref:ImmA/IrrE family metallo-endopeptidase n=1 Tax=Chlorobaculum parvum TaxID=274539 RepID=A0A7C5DGK3_9CHLB|nr:ImmA/IrrE family metallo-endopeptidase [Chlorobaculum parvum]